MSNKNQQILNNLPGLIQSEVKKAEDEMASEYISIVDQKVDVVDGVESIGGNLGISPGFSGDMEKKAGKRNESIETKKWGG